MLLTHSNSLDGIEDRIFATRGVQVMLDTDIAALFQADVKRLNEQRKRNQGRFPVDFCFRITKEERDCLRSQIATLTERTRDRKYLPYVFAKDNWPREPCCAYGHINIVSSKITSRGVQVMLDSDIARLFQVGIKLMNQQMKRNPDRFPRIFVFG